MLLLYVLCELSKMWKTCWNRCAKLPLLRLSRPSSRSPGSQTCEKDSRSKVLKKAWWRIKNTKKLEMTGLGNFNIRHRGVRVCQCQGIKWVRTRERINRYLDIGPKQTYWANSTVEPFYRSSLFYLEPNAPFSMTHEEQLCSGDCLRDLLLPRRGTKKWWAELLGCFDEDFIFLKHPSTKGEISNCVV